MRIHYLILFFCASLSALAQNFERKEIRLALPYRQSSLELIPFYWALQRKRFQNAGLKLKLIYTGSSRVAIETVLRKESDIALSDAQIFTIYAAQLLPLLAFLQYQQTNPYTRLLRSEGQEKFIYLNEEDAIPTAIILFNQSLSQKHGAVLLKERSQFWSLLPTCDAQPRFSDQKNTANKAQNCLEFSVTPLLLKKLDFLGRKKTTATFENPLPERIKELPGSLFLAHNTALTEKRSLLQSFSKIIIEEMRETFLFPEQIRDRGLWSIDEEIPDDQRLVEMLDTLGESFYRYQPRLEFGKLYAQRYQHLITVMENLNIILPGLSSNVILQQLP